MLQLLRTTLGAKKGNTTAIIVGALIIAVAIMIGVMLYTQNQTHPFWEVK